jgi:hypothetical protein
MDFILLLCAVAIVVAFAALGLNGVVRKLEPFGKIPDERLSILILGLPAVGSIWFFRMCRFVVTGPESGYDTCDGPGGFMSVLMSGLFGIAIITASVIALVIHFVWIRSKKLES